MELPVHDSRERRRRSPAEIRALAIVIQANLVQLRTAARRRSAPGLAIHGIEAPSPGRVAAMREGLIPVESLKAATDGELLILLHEVWGQYCLMVWAHEAQAREPGLDFGTLPADTEVHCEAALRAKEAEVHALLWRLQHEMRRRDGSLSADSHPSNRIQTLADRIPAEALGKPVGEAGDAEVRLAACQHAGMLAVLRWLLDASWNWSDPALARVAEWPF